MSHFRFTFVSPPRFSHGSAYRGDRCASGRHGFVMRSPGSWLGGSRVSAPRLFCLAPPGHLVKFWPCAVVSRMTRSGLGTQAALSLRLIAAFGYTIPNCGVLFLFLGLPVFCFCFVRVFWLLVFFLVAVFCFLSWNGAIYTCTTNQVAFHSIGSTCNN